MGKFVLFGGKYTTGNYHEFPSALGDTWTWDGSSWSQVTLSSPGPVARYAAGITFDPVHGVLILHGGWADNNPLSDTWTWNGTRWSLTGPETSPPAIFELEPMCWDGTHHRALLFDWTGLMPAPGVVPLDQTWAWDGTNWAQLAPSGAPSGFEGSPADMTYDPRTTGTLFFGHVNGIPTTWSFDGTNWVKAASNAGTASNSFTMSPDDAASNVVLFGENGDTWTWDGSRWTVQNPDHSPSARRGAVMAYDPVHNQVVLFGGSTGTGADLKELNDVWAWNGTDWTQVSPGG